MTLENNIKPNITRMIKDFHPDFNPSFETRVMDQIKHLSGHTYSTQFNHAFHRILWSGAAAVIILLITIYLNDGNLSSDTLIGTGNLNIESLTAMALNGY